MKIDQSNSMRTWYILHESRRKQLEAQKEERGLSHAEQVMLAHSIVTLLELEEMIQEEANNAEKID